MKEGLSYSSEPTCQVHESFFTNAVYIQDDDYQGYLSKRMSPGLTEGCCTCIDRSQESPISADCELFKPPAPPYDFESDPDDTMEASTMSTDNEGHFVPSPSVSLWDEDEAHPPSMPGSRSSSVDSSTCQNSNSASPSSLLRLDEQPSSSMRVLRSTKSRQAVVSEKAGTSETRSATSHGHTTDNQPRKRLPSCGPSEEIPKRRRLRNHNTKPRGGKPKARRPNENAKTKKGKPSDGASSVHPDLAVFEDGDRTARDRFLVEKRKQGLSYSEIKAMGHFKEAESTLRGRFRTLTKDKEARVRKPQWTPEDIRLLPLAVETACEGNDPEEMHVPWEKVAMILYDNGGSYRFGSGACHKAWDKVRRGMAR